MDPFLRAVADPGNARLSSEEITSAGDALKAVRLNTRLCTLEDLAIGCVIKNRCSFLDHKLLFFSGPNNHFERLPFVIISKLISAVISHEQGVHSDKEMQCLLLQLLTSKVTEFDIDKAIKKSKGSKDLSAMYFRHMLQNCPRVKKAIVSGDIWENFSCLPRLRPDSLLTTMASCWPNLSSLSVETMPVGALYFSYNSKEVPKTTIIENICDSLPNLSTLEVTVERVYEKDVDQFPKMQKLKNLRLHIVSYEPDVIQPVVQIAGRSPALQRFSFTLELDSDHKKYHADFLKQFPQLYPDKKLTFTSLWLDLKTTGEMPPNVGFEELHLSGDTSTFNLKPCDKLQKIFFSGVPYSNAISLLKMLGATVSEVSLDWAPGRRCSIANRFLDVLAILTTCPSLQSLKVATNGGVDKRTINKLTPAHFKRLKSLKFNSSLEFAKKSEHLQQIEKLYLKFFTEGQKVFKQYFAETQPELKAVVMTLKDAASTCFDELEVLQLKNTRQYRNDALHAVGLLLQRSPSFRTVSVCPDISGSLRLPLWFEQVITNAGINGLVKVCTDRSHGHETEEDDDDDDDDYMDDDDSDDDYGFGYDGYEYDSDGNPQFDDIQGYLMWKDSW